MLELTPDELLSTTRAVRKRLDLTRPVEREVLEECLRLAQQAPTASYSQNWHFVVVTDADKRARLGELWREVAYPYLQRGGGKGGPGDHLDAFDLGVPGAVQGGLVQGMGGGRHRVMYEQQPPHRVTALGPASRLIDTRLLIETGVLPHIMRRSINRAFLQRQPGDDARCYDGQVS